MKDILKKIPANLNGKIVVRKEECRVCKEKIGKQIGAIDYWDIKSSRIIKCSKCGLAQLDPMLTQKETTKGCLAYFIEESLRMPVSEQEKNLVRNFRRGLLFGISLKRKNVIPNEILEFGPGSGYFSDGIKFIFPKTKVTVMDINKEVLTFNKLQHQYDVIQSALEDYIPELDKRFDLIIARDVLEHVIDISMVIQNIGKYSKEGGLLHFITPNGHEDVWKHYLTYNCLNSNSELLINHVNYFDGKGLLDFLKENNFSPIEYYTYKLKTTRRGNGWKINSRLMAPISDKKNSDFYINKEIYRIKDINFNKKEVLNKWYINKKRKFIAYILSWYHHTNFIKLSPELNVGHEIFGLFKKTR